MTLIFSENAFQAPRGPKESRRSRRVLTAARAAVACVGCPALEVLWINSRWIQAFLSVLALILGFAATSAAAEGQGLIRSVEMRLDASRTLQADMVLAEPMEPTDVTPSTGFTRAILWLKITVDPPPKSESAVLTVFPAVLDDLTLYPIDAAGHLMSPQRSGDMVPLAKRDMPSLVTHDFVLSQAERPQTYLLRIDTSSGVMIRLEALAATDAAVRALNDLLVSSFTIAVKLFSVMLLVLHGSHLPRRINLVVAATIACFALVPFTRFGYFQMIFPEMAPDLVSVISAIVMILAIGVLILFLRLFMTPFAPSRVSLVLANVAIGANFLALPAALLGFQQLAAIISTAVFACVTPVSGLLLLTLRRDAYLGRRTVRIIYGTFTALLALLVMTTFDVMKAGPLYRLNLEIVGIGNSTLILALILMLNRSIKRRRQAAEIRIWELDIEKEELLKTRRFQKSLIDAISDQSQNTATKIRNLIASEEQKGGVPKILDPLMGRIGTIIEHCRQAGRIEHGEWQVDLLPVEITAVLTDLAKDIAPERFQISTPEHLVALCDRDLIEVALGHLMSNAALYSAPGSLILIRAEPMDQNRVQITISNQTRPDSSIEPDRLFEKFYRGPEVQSISGTGLGLFIAREILITLRGTIAARLSEGMLHFALTVPRPGPAQ